MFGGKDNKSAHISTNGKSTIKIELQVYRRTFLYDTYGYEQPGLLKLKNLAKGHSMITSEHY